MTRISPVSPERIRAGTRIALWFVRRGIARATGVDDGDVTLPLRLYAHLPALLRAYMSLERATAGLHTLDARLHVLAELRAATIARCEFCIDLGSVIAHRSGITDEELQALPHYQSSPLFSELDRLVLDYATAMSRTPVDVPEVLFSELRARLNEPQVVELTHHIALESMRGRFNLALGVGSSRLSEGMVCALPAD